MSMNKIALLSQRRAFVTSLFGLTFFAACLTVSASNLLPCPVRPNKHRFADDHSPEDTTQIQLVKRPKRWIEEKIP